MELDFAVYIKNSMLNKTVDEVGPVDLLTEMAVSMFLPNPEKGRMGFDVYLDITPEDVEYFNNTRFLKSLNHAAVKEEDGLDYVEGEKDKHPRCMHFTFKVYIPKKELNKSFKQIIWPEFVAHAVATILIKNQKKDSVPFHVECDIVPWDRQAFINTTLAKSVMADDPNAESEKGQE